MSSTKRQEQLDAEIAAATEAWIAADRRLTTLKEQREDCDRRVPTEAELTFLRERNFVPQTSHTPPRKWARTAAVGNTTVSVHIFWNAQAWGVGVDTAREGVCEIDEYCRTPILEDSVNNMLTTFRTRASVLECAQRLLMGHTDE
jgi:hypothetical protein